MIFLPAPCSGTFLRVSTSLTPLPPLLCGKFCTFTPCKGQLKKSVEVKFVKGVVQQRESKRTKDVGHYESGKVNIA